VENSYAFRLISDLLEIVFHFEDNIIPIQNYEGFRSVISDETIQWFEESNYLVRFDFS
jgi:hypothetical protein